MGFFDIFCCRRNSLDDEADAFIADGEDFEKLIDEPSSSVATADFVVVTYGEAAQRFVFCKFCWRLHCWLPCAGAPVH